MIVPVSYWVILALGVPQAMAIKVAFGTSLLVILPTAISGALVHQKKGAVHWRAALMLGSSGFLGGLIGAALAAHIPGAVLELGFGGLVLAMALWMGLETKARIVESTRPLRENPALLATCGFPIGMVTGLTGVGGGVLMVPLLVLVFHFPVHIAVGTSIATIVFTSLGGVIGYILSGSRVAGMLPYSLGYINLPIWLCLVATSAPLARLGARAAHALPADLLRYMFIAFLIYVGLKMIRVF